MPDLLALAEEVTKLHAVCVETGRRQAHFSHKIAGSDETVELGEKDKYIPLARHAFVAARKKIMASTHVTTLLLILVESEKISKWSQNKQWRGLRIFAVIKGFGYGTDDTVLAKVYAEEGVDYLAVAYVEEGVQLREAGVKGKIMVLNPDPETFDM